MNCPLGSHSNVSLCINIFRLNWFANNREEVPQSQVVKHLRNENKLKQSSGELGSIVPVALQYLYKGSTTVQGPQIDTSKASGKKIINANTLKTSVKKIIKSNTSVCFVLS